MSVFGKPCSFHFFFSSIFSPSPHNFHVKAARMEKLEIKRKFEFILFKNYIPGNTWKKSNFEEEHKSIQFSCHVYCYRVPNPHY